MFGDDWGAVEAPGNRPMHWSRRWIVERASLTEVLRACCLGEFNVRVLHHRFESGSPVAADTLRINPGDNVLQREVLLCDAETPLVFACSLLPEIALTGRFAPLRNLGSRPLGHWLFSQPALTRRSMSQASLSSDLSLFVRISGLLEPGENVPGRRTLFEGADRPFLVSEFFLPALASY